MLLTYQAGKMLSGSPDLEATDAFFGGQNVKARRWSANIRGTGRSMCLGSVVQKATTMR